MSEQPEHPDVEALSAYVDAQDSSYVATHIQSCAECGVTVARLGAARDAVARSTPPPADAARERAIAAALAAADEWMKPATVEPVAPAPAAPNRAAPPRPAHAPVVPLASPARTRRWVVASGIAAAVILVVGAVGLLSRGGGSQTDTALRSGPPAAESAVSQPPSAKAGLATVELGDVADVNGLRSRVAGSSAGAATAAGAAVAAPVAPTADASGRSSTAAGSTSNALASGGAATSPAPAAAQVGTRVCEEQARTARPSLAVLVYAANLRFAGTPAVALGFATTASGPPATLLVLAPGQGCRILAETSLP